MLKKFNLFNKDMSEKDRLLCNSIIGIVLILFAIYLLFSVGSYLISWETDQSLLNSNISQISESVDAENMGGVVGNKIGYLLVGRWFGLASFIIVFLLAYLAIDIWKIEEKKKSKLRITVISLTATLICSWILAWISNFLGLDTTFGGGLGGECGIQMVRWFSNLFGNFLTLIIFIGLLCIWAFFASQKFLKWFNTFMQNLISKKEGSEEESGEKAEEKPAKKGFTWFAGHKKDEAEEEDIEEEKPQVETKEVEDNSEIEVANSPVQSNEEESISVEPVPATEVPTTQSNAEVAESATEQSNEDNFTITEGKPLSTEGKDLPHINVRDELPDYQFPSLDLLKEYENSRVTVSKEELKKNNCKIRTTLQTYKIEVDKVTAAVGPTVTLYKIYPAAGVRIATIINLQDDIAMSLGANGVRVCKLQDCVGIEVANEVSSIVPLRAMLNDKLYKESKAELPVAIGYTILTQEVKVFDLADLPHLLIAGATKQGKSVGLNVIISSLLYAKHPSELKFVFIDPKKVEFTAYARLIKHYLAVLPTASSDEDEMKNAIAKDAKPAEEILRSLCIEMDARYDLLSKALVNNVKAYNEKYKERKLLPTEGHKYLPYIVTVVDEYADLTMSAGSGSEAKATARSINDSIIRLAQKGRAAGIHVIIATQRPSVDVITGIIKGNFTARIAFRVLSGIDSKTILDSPGAEKLIGRGDMIYFDGGDRQRVQCAFVSMEEINNITKFIGSQQGYKKGFNTPYYLPAPNENMVEDGVGAIDMSVVDERFEEAAKMVVMNQKGSTSDLQRRLGMGYAKAGRIMDQLEAAGVVGPQEGSKPREVLVQDLSELDGILAKYR